METKFMRLTKIIIFQRVWRSIVFIRSFTTIAFDVTRVRKISTIESIALVLRFSRNSFSRHFLDQLDYGSGTFTTGKLIDFWATDKHRWNNYSIAGNSPKDKREEKKYGSSFEKDTPFGHETIEKPKTKLIKTW